MSDYIEVTIKFKADVPGSGEPGCSSMADDVKADIEWQFQASMGQQTQSGLEWMVIEDPEVTVTQIA